MPSITDLISAGSTAGGFVVASGAAWFAWREYNEHQAMRRADLAASLYAQIANDLVADFAVTSLDWGMGLVFVPPDWRPLVEKEKMMYDSANVEDALQVQLTETTANNGFRSLYRHAFVRLFNQLEMVAHHARRDPKLIQELGDFAFIAHRLCRPKYVQRERAPENRDLYLRAIEQWYSADLVVFIRELAAAFPQADAP